MLNSVKRRGQLFVVSAPSGTGKTTVVERLAERMPGLRQSRSYTSRRVRPGESDGVDYNFVSRDRFEAMIAGDQFLEWAGIFDHLYGTSLVDTERVLAAGEDLVLVIDVQGARKVRGRGVPLVSIFVLPPTFETLERRLRGRSLDSDDDIRRRLIVARSEVQAYTEYDYVVVNDELEACMNTLAGIVTAERARVDAMTPAAEAIVASFASSENGQA